MRNLKAPVVFNVLWISVLCLASKKSQKPNIIIITADDMGWNDVSFHGSNLYLTPNIDALAYHGIILNDFHTPSLCSPSRTALMTGKFPLTTGMQRLVILEAEPRGLPLNLRILPQYLKEAAGYTTHLVGKWHLGFYEEAYTPTRRGFDSFYGFWQEHQDYFRHNSEQTFGNLDGYDMHRNLEADWTTIGEYSTDLYTRKTLEIIEKHDKTHPLFLYLSQIAPHAGSKFDYLQAPIEEENKYSYIPDSKKRKYAAMVSKLDKSVGQVIKALNDNEMLENSIVLFISDNGAPTLGIYGTTGSNYPFRGIKQTEWEGGTRVPAFIWSPLLDKQQRQVSNMMMHMVDILPTLLSAAGMSVSENLSQIDGINMWEALLEGCEESPRNEYPYNIDPAGKDNATGAVRFHNWKYFKGNENSTGDPNTWYNDLSMEPFAVHYDPELILQSEVNLAIASFHENRIEQNENGQTDEKDKVATDAQTANALPLTPQKILNLREKATIKCDIQKSKSPCEPEVSACLIDLAKDPCERYNLAEELPSQYEVMKGIFEKFRRRVVPPINKAEDMNANPLCWGGAWTPWYNKQNSACRKSLIRRLWMRLYNFVRRMFSWAA